MSILNRVWMLILPEVQMQVDQIDILESTRLPATIIRQNFREPHLNSTFCRMESRRIKKIQRTYSPQEQLV